MPNWCNNTISISGPTDKIKQIWATTQQEDSGLLEAICPAPQDMFKGNLGEAERAECEEKGIPNWYDWCTSNWGTKWDVSDEGLEFIDYGNGTSEITGWFDSAWAPPIGAYDTFTAANPDCSVDALYEEGGMDFAGHYADGQDDYIDGVSDYARAKIIRGDSGSDLYDRLDGELELTEARREYIQEELNEDAQKVHDLVVEKRAQNMEHKIDG